MKSDGGKNSGRNVSSTAAANAANASSSSSSSQAKTMKSALQKKQEEEELKKKQEIQEEEEKRKLENLKKQRTVTRNPEHLKFPLLEQLKFGRVVLDEFHEAEALGAEQIARLMAITEKANRRWGLTGTPALSTLQDVARTAALFHVEIPYVSDILINESAEDYMRSVGISNETRRFSRYLDLAESERLVEKLNKLMKRPCRQKLAIQNGQQFVQNCIRQNSEADALAKLKTVSHKIKVIPSFAERALYLDEAHNIRYVRQTRDGVEDIEPLVSTGAPSISTGAVAAPFASAVGGSTIGSSSSTAFPSSSSAAIQAGGNTNLASGANLAPVPVIPATQIQGQHQPQFQISTSLLHKRETLLKFCSHFKAGALENAGAESADREAFLTLAKRRKEYENAVENFVSEFGKIELLRRASMGFVMARSDSTNYGAHDNSNHGELQYDKRHNESLPSGGNYYSVGGNFSLFSSSLSDLGKLIFQVLEFENSRSFVKHNETRSKNSQRKLYDLNLLFDKKDNLLFDKEICNFVESKYPSTCNFVESKYPSTCNFVESKYPSTSAGAISGSASSGSKVSLSTLTSGPGSKAISKDSRDKDEPLKEELLQLIEKVATCPVVNGVDTGNSSFPQSSCFESSSAVASSMSSPKSSSPKSSSPKISSSTEKTTMSHLQAIFGFLAAKCGTESTMGLENHSPDDETKKILKSINDLQCMKKNPTMTLVKKIQSTAMINQDEKDLTKHSNSKEGKESSKESSAKENTEQLTTKLFQYMARRIYVAKKEGKLSTEPETRYVNEDQSSENRLLQVTATKPVRTHRLTIEKVDNTSSDTGNTNLKSSTNGNGTGKAEDSKAREDSKASLGVADKQEKKVNEKKVKDKEKGTQKSAEEKRKLLKTETNQTIDERPFKEKSDSDQEKHSKLVEEAKKLTFTLDEIEILLCGELFAPMIKDESTKKDSVECKTQNKDNDIEKSTKKEMSEDTKNAGMRKASMKKVTTGKATMAEKAAIAEKASSPTKSTSKSAAAQGNEEILNKEKAGKNEIETRVIRYGKDVLDIFGGKFLSWENDDNQTSLKGDSEMQRESDTTTKTPHQNVIMQNVIMQNVVKWLHLFEDFVEWYGIGGDEDLVHKSREKEAREKQAREKLGWLVFVVTGCLNHSDVSTTDKYVTTDKSTTNNFRTVLRALLPNLPSSSKESPKILHNPNLQNQSSQSLSQVSASKTTAQATVSKSAFKEQTAKQQTANVTTTHTSTESVTDEFDPKTRLQSALFLMIASSGEHADTEGMLLQESQSHFRTHFSPDLEFHVCTRHFSPDLEFHVWQFMQNLNQKSEKSDSVWSWLQAGINLYESASVKRGSVANTNSIYESAQMTNSQSAHNLMKEIQTQTIFQRTLNSMILSHIGHLFKVLKDDVIAKFKRWNFMHTILKNFDFTNSSENGENGGENGGQNEAAQEQTCSICLEDSSVIRNFAITPCSHTFCRPCLDLFHFSRNDCYRRI